MGNLDRLLCIRCGHEAHNHSTNGKRCTGLIDGDNRPVDAGATKQRGYDYCSCMRSRSDVEKAERKGRQQYE
jgi:hypothetical protein